MFGRDPAFYFAVILAIIATQILVWSTARHTSDIEWWRAAAFGVVGAICGSLAITFLVTGSGISQIAGILLGGAFVSWILSGWLYEMDLWQRIVLVLSTPLIGSGAMICGGLLRVALYRSLGFS